MKDKISYLMKSENLSNTRFAEILGIQPSAVSHLVSGRNKPGYDLLQRILRRFPRINPDWLLLDAEEPYRHDIDDNISDMSGVSEGELPLNEISLSETSPSQSSKKIAFELPINREKLNSRPSTGQKSPIFVVVFYDDGSCERFSM